ncbi:MAG: carboxyl-terminal processing protease [Paraglaciecola sp.]|jgi:carboxyl-terminal processing protease
MVQEETKIPRKLNIWLPLLFALVLAAGMLIGTKLRPVQARVTIGNSDAEVPASSMGQGKIEELIRYIEARYVDEVDRETLVQEAIDEILSKLDPHSNYISADDLKGVNESLEGEFDGIGIEFLVVDDTLIVVTPLAGGPSETAGILAGDKMIEVSDSIISGVKMKSSNVMDLLRGKKGTEVTVKILRGKETHEITITRDKIPNHSVDVSYMLDEKTGYIKVNRFSATTYEEFMKSLEDLKEKSQMEDLVIDLRGNPGGYLNEATSILSQLFREQKRLMVYTEGRTVKRNDYETTGRNFHQVDDIAVLIDEGSASASEIVAGAMQDWDRAVVIGRRSFGKGLVQEQYQLRDGSALRLTVARYYTPSGRLIQKNYEDKEAYNRDVIERFNNGELYNSDSIQIADSTIFETAGGRTVFGGGGITPDIFVPFDSTILNDYYLQLRGQIPGFVYRFMDNNQSNFQGMLLDKFQKEYTIDDKAYLQLVNYAAEHNVPKNMQEIEAVKADVKHFLKARMAKHLYGDIGLYTILNEDDEAIQTAVKTLLEDKPLTGNN